MTAQTVLHHDVEPRRSPAAGSEAVLPSGPLDLQPDLFAPSTPVETLQTVVRMARRTFGCDGAGIMLAARGGGSAAAVASGTEAARAEAMQIDHYQGPAYGALTEWQPVVSAELRFDSRWRFWAPQAADLGFRSVRSLTLSDGEPFGALTLYSRRPAFFRTESLTAELGFASQASIAIAGSVEREQLLRARDSRGVVGQAQGILMERHRLDSEQAFAVLRRYSSHLNQKLRVVAERVISGGGLPELDRIGLPA
jgi:uncharacterized protein YigA (DUF484 family)